MKNFKAYVSIIGIVVVVLTGAACLAFGLMSRKKVKTTFSKLW